jgi:hypothetical protein
MLPLHKSPRTESVLHLADWLELQLLQGESWRVTEANSRTHLESQGLHEAFGPSVPGAVLAMHRRAKILAERYPLVTAVGGLRRRALTPNVLPYLSLLTISAVDFDAAASALPEAATMFERFCEIAIQDVAGGHAVHFGWPNRSGRPEGFSDAIRWLAARLNLKLSAGYREPRRRDGGADLVGWRSLEDGRTFDYRLIQCTVGHDILRKAREVDVAQWMRWIDFLEVPRVSLALPYQTASRSVEVRQAEALGALVLDRTRLLRRVVDGTDRLLPICYEVLTSAGLITLIDSGE